MRAVLLVEASSLLSLLGAAQASRSTFRLTSGECIVDNACLYSNNYPEPYGSSTHCSFEIERNAVLRVAEFDTEAGYDILTVDSKAYSGLRGPEGVMVSAGTSFITWYSDSSIESFGFRVCDASLYCAAGDYLWTIDKNSSEYSGAVDKNKTCLACPANSYSSGGTVDACTPCAAGLYSKSGASECSSRSEPRRVVLGLLFGAVSCFALARLAIMKRNQRRCASDQRARSSDELPEGQRGPVTRCGHARVVPMILPNSSSVNEVGCPTTRMQQQGMQPSSTPTTPDTPSSGGGIDAAAAPPVGSGEDSAAAPGLHISAVSAVRLGDGYSASWHRDLPVATAVGPPLLAERLNGARHH